MARRLVLLAVGALSLAALAGCGSAEDARPAVETTREAAETPRPAPPPVPSSPAPLPSGFAPVAFDLAGSSWIVTAIDGVSLADRYEDLATVHFTANMIFWQACNHHEGIYATDGGSFAVLWGPATLANCPPSSPDRIMARVLGGRPLIGGNREGRLMMAGGGHTLILAEIDRAYGAVRSPPLEAGPFLLNVSTIRPVLRFASDGFSIWAGCDRAITGRAFFTGGRLRTGDVTATPCPGSETPHPAVEGMARLLRENPAMAVGPNGELLIVSGDAQISGRQCHPDPSPCEHAMPRPRSGGAGIRG